MANSMKLNITNSPTSGASSDDVYISIFGNDPNNDCVFSYYDFSTGTMKAYSSYQSGVTSSKLSDITMPFTVGEVESGRMYIAVNGDFTSMADSGPTASKGNNVMFDKIEFTTQATKKGCVKVGTSLNVNPTSVDFYGLSFTVNVHGNPASDAVGYDVSRSTILTALNGIPNSAPDSQHAGNSNFYSTLMVTDPSGNILRFLAPKTAAYSDFGSSQAYQEFTHYLNDYITNECFKPNRVFSFYDKFYPSQKNKRWGQISADGTTCNLYTSDPTQPNPTPYAPVPSISRPCSPWGNPDVGETPSLFHRVSGTDNDDIDWGFLIIGNSAGSGLAANWGSDPACMAMMVSICRGVMHEDEGTTYWTNPDNYYLGDGTSGAPDATENFPILYYSSILHANGLNGKAYVLSYDDVYGENSSVFFDSGAQVDIDLVSMETVNISDL